MIDEAKRWNLTYVLRSIGTASWNTLAILALTTMAVVLLKLSCADFAKAQEIDSTLADAADKIACDKDRRCVRVINVAYDKNAVPASTDFGSTVEGTIKPDSLCNVILDAFPIAMSELYEGSEYVRNVPNAPELRDMMGKASWPVMLGNSCTHAGNCLWTALFRGQDCLTVAASPYYVASTMRELQDMKPTSDERALWTEGLCNCLDVGGQPAKCKCDVLVSDPRAIAHRAERIMHTWAGRDHDLGFRKATDGVLQDRKAVEAVEIPK